MAMGRIDGFSLLQRAMFATQKGMHVTAANIAGANEDGYVRRVLGRDSTDPVGFSDRVIRVHNAVLDRSLYAARARLSYDEMHSQILSRIESTLTSAASDGDISRVLSDLRNSLDAMASNPDTEASRYEVSRDLKLLAQTFNTTLQGIEEQRTSLRLEISLMVDRANAFASAIAKYNQQIINGGDLVDPSVLDERDRLLGELSALLGVRVEIGALQQPSAWFDNRPMVEASRSLNLSVVTEADGAIAIRIGDSDDLIRPQGGRLGALTEMHNHYLTEKAGELRAFMAALADRVNEMNAAGTDLDGLPGQPIYTITSGGLLAMAPGAEAKRLAASLTGSIGDGANARNMARMLDDMWYSGPTGIVSPIEWARQFAGDIGFEKQMAEQSLAQTRALYEVAYEIQQSESGVNIDEELLHMTQYQRDYQAAARMMTIMNETLMDVMRILVR